MRKNITLGNDHRRCVVPTKINGSADYGSSTRELDLEDGGDVRVSNRFSIRFDPVRGSAVLGQILRLNLTKCGAESPRCRDVALDGYIDALFKGIEHCKQRGPDMLEAFAGADEMLRRWRVLVVHELTETRCVFIGPEKCPTSDVCNRRLRSHERRIIRARLERNRYCLARARARERKSHRSCRSGAGSDVARGDRFDDCTQRRLCETFNVVHPRCSGGPQQEIAAFGKLEPKYLLAC
jgi:hypothetical protein